MVSLNEMKTKKQDNFPEWIVVHHTGGTNADPLADTSHHTFETIQNWHIYGRGWENIGYHWVIEKDGRVVAGRPESYHGAHCTGYNTKSVGVVLAGNFDATLPTEDQKKALAKLLHQTRIRWDIPLGNIVPHRTFANKSCYGNLLDENWAQDLLVDEMWGDDEDEHANCVPNELGALVKALLAKLKK